MRSRGRCVGTGQHRGRLGMARAVAYALPLHRGAVAVAVAYALPLPRGSVAA